MHLTEIIEDTFQKKNNSHYELSILVGMDSFVYAISDGPDIQVLYSFRYNGSSDALSTTYQAVEKIIGEEKNLTGQFESVKIGFHSPIFTIVPERLYNSESKAAYLTNVAQVPDTDRLLSNRLEKLNLRLVYSLDSNIQGLFRKKFPHAGYFHGLTPLLEGFDRISTSGERSRIFINFRNHSFDIVLFDDKELLFCNTFSLKTAKDGLYFILLIFDQFRIDQDKTVLFLCGDILEESALFKLLHKYIRHLEFLPSPDFITPGEKAKETDLRIFFNLFYLSLCKST